MKETLTSNYSDEEKENIIIEKVKSTYETIRTKVRDLHEKNRDIVDDIAVNLQIPKGKNHILVDLVRKVEHISNSANEFLLFFDKWIFSYECKGLDDEEVKEFFEGIFQLPFDLAREEEKFLELVIDIKPYFIYPSIIEDLKSKIDVRNNSILLEMCNVLQELKNTLNKTDKDILESALGITAEMLQEIN